MSPLSSLLANLSVGRKLALGFGLTLLLTLAVMLIGQRGLLDLASGSDTLGALNELDRAALGTRLVELRLILEGDSAHAEQLQQDIAALHEAIARLTGSIGADMAVLEEDLQRYQAAVEALLAAAQAHRKAEDTLIHHADASTLSLGSLQRQALSALEFSDDIPAGLADVRGLAELVDQLLLTRQHVETLRVRPDQAAADAASKALGRTFDLLSRLRKTLGPSLASQLFLVDGMLQSYRDALAELQTSLANSQRARAELQRSADDFGQHAQALAERHKRHLTDAQRRSQIQLLIGAALALLLGSATAWLIARQVTIPLRRTLTFAGGIANGDLGQSLQVDRRDELGQLQRAMLDMQHSLRQLIGGIGQDVLRLGEAASGLSAVSSRNREDIDQQKQETDQVATAIEQMAATVQEVARYAVDTAQASQQAGQQAQEGDELVAQMISRMERTARQVAGSADAMARLEDDSQAIGSVLLVIRNVAEQTNLLALNAAIEAARAGDAGRGFAVVADEVRGLAQRTRQSTEEIQQLIEALQHGTQQAMDSMQQSRELSDATVGLSRRAGSLLTDISQRIAAIDTMNQQIAAATEQQSSVAEEISRSIVSVRDVAERSAAAGERNACASQELVRLGENLQQRVGRFRL
ncbi:HAMP domain-containing protein [Pseudomonas stutzeri]|uniref:Chemotaxis protein n=1 Tax=Stutzerimonas stutzeri KOS6 TaxID=1218352 RepID=A0A061JWR3_STUST|nr:methyl-accepting chemotaxis protein [Stutzerimonas stutzeri]EWC43269.1 chemotaxis protein [Stutzerimonas stutzeri KOS6]MBK3869038.1 HAMP domain-containing protein [Stutzerimonas stutzeri]